MDGEEDTDCLFLKHRGHWLAAVDVDPRLRENPSVDVVRKGRFLNMLVLRCLFLQLICN